MRYVHARALAMLAALLLFFALVLAPALADDCALDITGDGKVDNNDAKVLLNYFHYDPPCPGNLYRGVNASAMVRGCSSMERYIVERSLCRATEPAPVEPAPVEPGEEALCAHFKDQGSGTQRCKTLEGETVFVVSPAPGGWTIPPTCVNSFSDANSRCESDGRSILPGQIFALRVVHKIKNKNDDTRPIAVTKSETPGEMVIRWTMALSKTPGDFDVGHSGCISSGSIETLDEHSRFSGLKFCPISVGTSYVSIRPRNPSEGAQCARAFGKRCRPKILGSALYE